MMNHHMTKFKKYGIKTRQRFDFPNIRLFQGGAVIQLTF